MAATTPATTTTRTIKTIRMIHNSGLLLFVSETALVIEEGNVAVGLRQNKIKIEEHH